MGNILLIDDDTGRRRRLSRYLSEVGHRVSEMNVPGSLPLIDRECFDLAIVNLFPDGNRTWDYYRTLRSDYPGLPVVVYQESSFQAFRSLKQVITSIRKEKNRKLKREGECA